MTTAQQYCEDVVNGKIISGQYVKLACKRFLNDLKREDIYYDAELAQKLEKFCKKYLCFWEGAYQGKPAQLVPFQAFIISSIFCFKNKETNKRIYRQVYIQIARKNAKTTLAALITLIHIFLDNDHTPQVLVGANNEDQAKICTNTIGKILEYSPWFADKIGTDIMLRQYNGYYRTITSKLNDRDAIVQAMSRDPRTKDGFNPSLGIVDEFHEAQNDQLLNVIESGQGMRAEPLSVVITTAGFHKAGPCYSKLRKTGIEVLEGKIEDPNYLAIIYEQDKEDDWKDEETYIKSNPMLPHAEELTPFLKAQKQKAINQGGTKEVEFKTKNLNAWVDAAEVWIQDDIWLANHDPKLTPDDLIGQECYGGLDLAATRDLNAYTLLFPTVTVWGHDKKAVLLWTWIPEDNISEGRADYQKWVDDNHMIPTPGNHADQAAMLETMKQTLEQYEIKRLHYDRYLAESYGPAMVEAGLNVFPITIGGFNLSESMKVMEVDILKHDLEHFGNPILRWSLGNTIPKVDPNGNIRPNKENRDLKIDPIVSLILSYDCMLTANANPESEIFFDTW